MDFPRDSLACRKLQTIWSQCTLRWKHRVCFHCTHKMCKCCASPLDATKVSDNKTCVLQMWLHFSLHGHGTNGFISYMFGMFFWLWQRLHSKTKHFCLSMKCSYLSYDLRRCCALRLVPPTGLTTKRVLCKYVSNCRCTKAVVRGPVALFARCLECASGCCETQHSNTRHSCFSTTFGISCCGL